MKVLVKDATLFGKVNHELELEFESSTVTVREIIEQRVSTEIETYHRSAKQYFQGLVRPSHAEKTLNGYKLKKQAYIDIEKQTYIALDAFMKNAFFVLIDDLQAESLDTSVKLKPDTQINFVKLTPLVGG